jgi:hypothetical protein
MVYDMIRYDKIIFIPGYNTENENASAGILSTLTEHTNSYLQVTKYLLITKPCLIL